MSPVFDLILTNGTIVNQGGSVAADIAVRGGKIAGVGRFSPAQGRNSLDCGGLHILPGVIDTQVHFREPGMQHKEDLETGSRAAVMGGVTAVFEMPNTKPSTTSPATLEDKLRRALNRMYCDYAFYIGATRENADALGELEGFPGCCGVKVFLGSSTGELLLEDAASLKLVLSRITRRAAFHSEDEARLRERKALQVPGDPSSHPIWRDAEAARLSTERLLHLARSAGKRVHVLHVSTADEIPLLAANKDIASCEVTPHHLTLAAPEAYDRLGTRAQMNPPVRDGFHREALWAAVRAGTVDVLGSDHAPHTLEEKLESYPSSPSGMPGVQTLVPVMLDHIAAGRLSIERFVELTSEAPARIFGIASKGRMATGYDADFTIVDLKAKRRITNAWIESRCRWTPYDGLEVKGWPIGTILRGNIVMWEGRITSPPHGRPMHFADVESSMRIPAEQL
jgi:dihydroorotase